MSLPLPLSLRLKPFTSYQFRVKATNDIGDSDYSEESEAITTLQDGEAEIVVLFALLDLKSQTGNVAAMFVITLYSPVLFNCASTVVLVQM